jgi:hypothetical protein
LSATRPKLIYIVIQREEEVQHMVQTRDKLHKAVERYKTEYNNLVARDVEEQVTHFKFVTVKVLSSITRPTLTTAAFSFSFF